MRSGDEILDTFLDKYESWIVIGLGCLAIGIVVVLVIGLVFAIFFGTATPDCIIAENGLEYCR